MMDTQSAPVETPESALQGYNQLIGPARQRFAASRGIRGMVSPDTGARTMAAFLMHFSGLSVPITEPVEAWIRRAGERCEALGLTEIGKALRGHSKAEAGHHQYHVDDFISLIRFWNTHWTPPADPDAIRAHGVTSGGERYSRVHEEVIAGPTPYCQFAIEYEIELLPVQCPGSGSWTIASASWVRKSSSACHFLLRTWSSTLATRSSTPTSWGG